MTARHWQILAVLILAEGVSALEYSMILAGLPVWLAQHGDPMMVGWLISGYFLVSGSSAALSARLGDIIGRKRVILLLLGCCVLGSLMSAMAPTLEWVIAGRSVQGFAGGIVALCAGLARETMPPAKVSFAVGAVVATATGGAALGLLLGGIFTDHFGPQSIFLVTAGTGLVALLLVILIIPPSPRARSRQRLDMLGAALMIPAIAALLLTVSNLARWDWVSLALVGGAGILLTGVWIWHELRHPEPLINLRLLGSGRLALANLLSAFSNGGAGQMTSLSSLLLQQPIWTGVGFGLSATFVGALKFPGLAIGVLGSLWAGSVAGRRGGHVPALAGAFLSFCALAFGLVYHDHIVPVMAMIILVNLGGSLIFAGTSAVIVEAAPDERTSEATGLNVVIRALAMALGAQIVAMLLASSTIYPVDGGRGLPDDTAYSRVLALITLTCSAAVLAALRLNGWRWRRSARTEVKLEH